ncbi:transglycosylase domain-containing protein [Methylocucumis oryzae]|uniref:transglycosylase domain-containing protein n=1 Tax=Methylocucumis oryzae TaxID=1632867 RepID=UPI0006975D4F|nr:transglycosylase domain-containing protein [Methylocucumis oryzae]
MRRFKRILYRLLTVYIGLGLITVAVIVGRLIHQEVKTSKYQAQYLTQISKQLSYKLVPGQSQSVRYPQAGPYDQRLGYTALPEAIKRLQNLGYEITAQAAFPPIMTELIDEYGLFTVYHEKSQAGLRIIDNNNHTIFSATYPEHGYAQFQDIPPVVLNTLLFIENRELLNQENTQVNPAIEWDRFGFAGLQLIANKLGVDSNVPGGSTLATQIEKYRHSPNGYTNSIVDKFRQMGTASVRAYLEGADTRAMRQEIALSYLNTMPLAATPQHGEVHGLGDGLSAWFNADFNNINSLLTPEALATTNISKAQAKAYRQVLNILLSQRRPTYLLGKGFRALQTLTDSYLRLLAEQGVISPELRDAALKETTPLPPRRSNAPTKFALERKTQSVLRARLAKALGVKSNYEMDRFDLTVKTTLDYKTQLAVTQELRELSHPDKAREAGIIGTRMLGDTLHLDPIVYSLIVYEKTKTGNQLRVQTDNYDQALDINEGIRLDLGSTSKLRTMVHYLELIAELYQQYQKLNRSELDQLQFHPKDYLSAWVREQLRIQPNISLEHLLYSALDKSYSASPNESFYTGGGLHTFSNFTKGEDNQIMSIRHALRDSVNLVFIRLMRDLVYHHLYKPGGIARWLEIPDSPKREEYLQRFADKEGSVYLRRFYSKYHGKTPDEILTSLAQRVLAKPSRLAMLYRSIYPERDEQALSHFLKTHLDKSQYAKQNIDELYNKYSPKNFDLQDQGYITKIHSLELWLAGYMAKNPGANLEQALAAGADARQQVYRWLIKSHKRQAQQNRIMNMLETEAFWEIHHAWQRVGYPFAALTPSYATAIGASGDRPAALAELVGILQNDGVKLPMIRFDYLQFAQGTPYETVMKKRPDEGERIFPAEVAKAARSALSGIVEGGTASRLNNIYTDQNGKPLLVGGKTGTGDHRKEIWGKGGRLIESKFVSRAAVFTFFLGQRFFGVITAYVAGENSGSYHFTSSLPVQILKHLKPTLTPLLHTAPAGEGIKTGETPTFIDAKPLLSKPKPKPAAKPVFQFKRSDFPDFNDYKPTPAPKPAQPPKSTQPPTSPGYRRAQDAYPPVTKPNAATPAVKRTSKPETKSKAPTPP